MKTLLGNFLLSTTFGILFISCSDYLNMEKDIKDRMTIEEVCSVKEL